MNRRSKSAALTFLGGWAPRRSGSQRLPAGPGMPGSLERLLLPRRPWGLAGAALLRGRLFGAEPVCTGHRGRVPWGRASVAMVLCVGLVTGSQGCLLTSSGSKCTCHVMKTVVETLFLCQSSYLALKRVFISNRTGFCRSSSSWERAPVAGGERAVRHPVPLSRPCDPERWGP